MAEATSGRVALVGARVVDGLGGAARANSTVVIDGAKIAEVSQAREFGSGVQVVDVGGKTVMPGLIDCHMHFAPWGMNLMGHQGQSLMLLACETVNALKATLQAGVTASRDLGGMEAGFSQAIARGVIAGPRIQQSLIVVSPTNGIVDATTAQGQASPTVPGLPDPNCNGPWQARAKVREVLRQGGDVIKIASTGGVSSFRVPPRRQIMHREEVEAIVDEAHNAGAPVACHALGGPGLVMAVRAGVDTIEHGGWLDEEAVEEMARRGTWYVPTFSIYRWHATIGPEFKQQRARPMREHHLRSFALARKAGVRIAMGTDAGSYGYGENALELELLVEGGMTPGEAIETSTRRAAECMGIDKETGTLEAGKLADLLVVDGDPLADVTVLRCPERLAAVVQAGNVVKGSL